jgi:hypothetical protein
MRLSRAEAVRRRPGDREDLEGIRDQSGELATIVRTGDNAVRAHSIARDTRDAAPGRVGAGTSPRQLERLPELASFSQGSERHATGLSAVAGVHAREAPVGLKRRIDLGADSDPSR